MTAKQKAAREKFKKVVAEASKLRKKNPKLTQAQAVKQAWAIQYSKEGKGKKVAAIKIIEKGESKSAKAKATYQQVRSKKGTFKGLKKVGYDQEITGSDFTRISNDTYGNPRYVIHFLKVDRDYDKAVKIANKVGGKKFHNKQYGGGIVFQSYNIDETARYLNNAISKNKKVGAASSKVKARKGKSTEMHTDTRSHNVNIRVVSGIPPYKDPDAAREIELYADNDSRLYFSRKLPILKNLQKKFQKGNYNIELAAKLWMYYINDAMQRYHKEFGSKSSKWSDLLSVADRKLLAREYAIDTLNEFEQGNFIV